MRRVTHLDFIFRYSFVRIQIRCFEHVSCASGRHGRLNFHIATSMWFVPTINARIRFLRLASTCFVQVARLINSFNPFLNDEFWICCPSCQNILEPPTDVISIQIKQQWPLYRSLRDPEVNVEGTGVLLPNPDHLRTIAQKVLEAIRRYHTATVFWSTAVAQLFQMHVEKSRKTAKNQFRFFHCCIPVVEYLIYYSFTWVLPSKAILNTIDDFIYLRTL